MSHFKIFSAPKGATFALASMATPWADGQSRLTVPDLHRSAKLPNVSVGFSFQPSFVTGSVLFEYDDGELQWHTEIDRDSDEYQEVIAKLSLPSSRHLA